MSPKKIDAKAKILDAALQVIRAQGYAATTVDDLCRTAGVTKGAFFHYFTSKEDMAVAAARYWQDMTSALFAAASYHRHADPLDRVLAYVDFRKSLITGDLAEWTCLVGTMTQEAYGLHPAIREACAECIFSHADTLVPDIQAAMQARGINHGWTATSLARHTQAVLQGAFILAKAAGDRAVALESVDHLRRYIEMLFKPSDAISHGMSRPSE